jgi:hypothetical protein
VAPDRIDTIIDFAAAAKYGVKTESSYAAATADVVRQPEIEFIKQVRCRFPVTIEFGEYKRVKCVVHYATSISDRYSNLDFNHST